MSTLSIPRSLGLFIWRNSATFRIFEIFLNFASRTALPVGPAGRRAAVLPALAGFAPAVPALAGHSDALVTRKEMNRDRSPERKGYKIS